MYYSAFQRKKVLTCTTTWMNLEDTMLSEVNHRKTSTVWFYLYEVRVAVQFTETGSWMVVARSYREGKWELLFNVYRVSVMQDKQNSQDGDDCYTMWMWNLKMSQMIHFTCISQHTQKIGGCWGRQKGIVILYIHGYGSSGLKIWSW